MSSSYNRLGCKSIFTRIESENMHENGQIRPTPGVAKAKILHRGGPFNAIVYETLGEGGTPRIVKDYGARPWLIRNTVGRWMVWREAFILRRLEGTGAVPAHMRKDGPFRISEDACPGYVLRDICTGVHGDNRPDPDKVRGAPVDFMCRPLPGEWFDRLEEAVARIHTRGWVHLDLHNARNVMVTPDLRPVILDWQSGIPSGWLPKFIRRSLENIDRAGVCKFRARYGTDPLTPEQEQFLAKESFIRRHFWVAPVRFRKKGRNA